MNRCPRSNWSKNTYKRPTYARLNRSLCCVEQQDSRTKGRMNAVNVCLAWGMALGCLTGSGAAGHADAHSRAGRQTKPEYSLDILVLGDYSLYSQWHDRSQPKATLTRDQVAKNDIRRYFTLVLNEVSEQYNRLDTKFRLKIRPVGFFIQSEKQTSLPWVSLENATALVEATPLLDPLVKWLKSQNSLPEYDHAMLFTASNLSTDSSGHTTGRANVGTLCHIITHSVSVIEDRGAFQSVRTAVHELGHSLNASHDGADNACSASQNYIMAPGSVSVTAENKKHPWHFSPCTVREIQSFVDNIISNTTSRRCLETALPQQDVPDVAGVIPGQLYSPDVTCQHLYGSTSSYCYEGNLSNICTYMPCGSDVPGPCNVHFAPTGTSCGDRKWCRAGECTADPISGIDPPPVADCQFGDQNVPVNGLTCSDMAKRSPQLCYDDNIRAVCCQSCKRVDSGKPGCPYGDRKGNCQTGLCKLIESNGYMYATDCCRTCGDFDSTSWTCADQPDGMTCAEAVRRQGIQGCYNTSLAYMCCATCTKQRNLARPKGCEYGDLLLSGCGRSSTASNANCDARTCCETCADTGTGSTHHVTLPVVGVIFLYNLLILLYAPFYT